MISRVVSTLNGVTPLITLLRTYSLSPLSLQVFLISETNGLETRCTNAPSKQKTTACSRALSNENESVWCLYTMLYE